MRRLSRVQRVVCVVPFLVAVAAFGVGVGTRPQVEPVCRMADDLDDVAPADALAPGGKLNLTGIDMERLIAKVDFDVLERSVPASLRDDVELVRREAPDQLAKVRGGGDLTSILAQLDPAFLAAVSAIFDWTGAHCA